MKNYNRFYLIVTFLFSVFLLQGCQLIADIFTAGFWVGIVLSVLVIVLIVWLIIKGMKWLRK